MAAPSEVVLEFEKPLIELERKLQDLRELAKSQGVDLKREIQQLEKKWQDLARTTYAALTPWQRVQLSRHPNRPYARDYLELLFPDFDELHGDRKFGDDPALMGGVASWPPKVGTAPGATTAQTQSVIILAHQKGRTTKQKMERNFGMARPEGYRKAVRLMEMADRFKMPMITLIDTPGAYPGMDAEERGQSQAIAESIAQMFRVRSPILSVVIGEGGSGGALAIGVGDRVLMQEFSTYSVISPESCASILWSDSSLAERAADRLKMSAQELLGLGVIDSIVREPEGGAHRDWSSAADLLGAALVESARGLFDANAPTQLRESRLARFRAMGQAAIQDHTAEA